MNLLSVQNHQQSRPLDLRFLRRLAAATLNELFGERDFDIGIRLVDGPEMACLNETFLSHAGSTDVLTFDYAGGASKRGVSGEIFICVEVAVVQAKRYRTSWQAELVRYLIHALLHLLGYDDRRAPDRRKMKSREDQILGDLRQRFALSKLRRRPRLTP